MNLNFLIKKKHVFKKRIKNKYKYQLNLQTTNGIYCKNKIRFELIYLKVFKKFFFSKKKKKKKRYTRKKCWIMVKPNFLLTMKSKNSRMGSGIGAYVRVVSLIKPNKPLILLKKYSIFFLRLIVKYLKLKLNINVYIIKNKLKCKFCII